MNNEPVFDSHFIISELNNNLDDFKSMLSAISREQYLWKPTPEKWCLLEIVCHLYDEEREDFRERLSQVLVTPDLPFRKINPLDWVATHDYINQDFYEMLNRFLEERKNSVKWLKSLSSTDYKLFWMHPKAGPVTGELLLSNWLAHDYHHFRQIIKLKYDYLKINIYDDLKYAGEW